MQNHSKWNCVSCQHQGGDLSDSAAAGWEQGSAKDPDLHVSLKNRWMVDGRLNRGSVSENRTGEHTVSLTAIKRELNMQPGCWLTPASPLYCIKCWIGICCNGKKCIFFLFWWRPAVPSLCAKARLNMSFGISQVLSPTRNQNHLLEPHKHKLTFRKIQAIWKRPVDRPQLGLRY